MSSYNTENIRNIAFVGHSGSGKTTLVEALLHKAGVIPSMGSVEAGNTVCDADPQEKEYRHSLSAAVVGFNHKQCHFNLVDTPGLPDFVGQTFTALPAAETIAIVVNAQAGIEMMTRRLMDWAGDEHFCRMIVINKIDSADVDLNALLDQLKEAFGKEVIPLNLPTEDRSKVVDCFFDTPSVDAIASPAEVHASLVEQVVEMDEETMNTYLEEGDVPAEKLHDPFEKALREAHILPVCFVSATTGAGVEELLDVLRRLGPNPKEGNPHPFKNLQGSEATPIAVDPDPDKHVVAHVFKVTHDPFVGKLGIFRIHQGIVTKDTQLFVDDHRRATRVAHLLRVRGKQYEEADVGLPGDICAVGKFDDMRLNAILHNSHDEDYVRLSSGKLPPPVAGLAIVPRNRGDEKKLADALEKLTGEDPCLIVEHVETSHETVLRGLGELHLRIALERMKNVYNVEVDTHPPAIAYRETIAANAEGHHRHKKQSGGAGQFGEVYLRVEPLPRGEGFEFVDAVVGGNIPRQFIPAVEKGVRQAIIGGAIAGYPVHDVRVTVYDGKHHPVDSQEVSFIMAGKKAFVDALQKANPIILEPIVTVYITAPSHFMGDIAGDLSGHRGRISNTEVQPGGQLMLVTGQAPLAELTDFPVRLKSLTGGEGSCTMEFSHYEALPAHLQQKLVAAYNPHEEG